MFFLVLFLFFLVGVVLKQATRGRKSKRSTNKEGSRTAYERMHTCTFAQRSKGKGKQAKRHSKWKKVEFSRTAHTHTRHRFDPRHKKQTQKQTNKQTNKKKKKKKKKKQTEAVKD